MTKLRLALATLCLLSSAACGQAAANDSVCDRAKAHLQPIRYRFGSAVATLTHASVANWLPQQHQLEADAAAAKGQQREALDGLVSQLRQATEAVARHDDARLVVIAPRVRSAMSNLETICG